MKTILHIQSDSTDKADIFVIDDGVPMPFSDSIAEHMEAARMLNGAIDWMMISLPSNKNIRCYRSCKGTYIQSNYKEKDVVGRRIAFRFYTDSKSLDTACEILKEMSAKIGRQCDDIELSSLKQRDKSVNKQEAFLFYQNTLIDDNGNIVSSDNPKYQSMMSKFEQERNRQLENGFYFLKQKSKLNPFSSDKILFIQSVFDDDYKFWIENPKSIDDTINHLTNLSKYFEKQVSDSDIKTLRSKSNYGK